VTDPVLERRDSMPIGTAVVRAGEAVDVAGWRGRFTFQELVTNTATGQQWANVFGGPPGRERARSVSPDRVRRAPGSRTAVQLALELGPRPPGPGAA